MYNVFPTIASSSSDQPNDGNEAEKSMLGAEPSVCETPRPSHDDMNEAGNSVPGAEPSDFETPRPSQSDEDNDENNVDNDFNDDDAEFRKHLVHATKERAGQASLAKAFHSMFKNRFAYLGKENEWFAFKAPRWRREKSNTTSIYALIDNEFMPRIMKHVAELEHGSEEDMMLAEKMWKIVSTKLTDVTFQDKLIKKLKTSCAVDNVADRIGRIDRKKEILGFDGNVYDFSIKH